MKIAFIDHYDSFSYNLIDWIRKTSLPIELELLPFDDERAFKKLYQNPLPILISPGPNSPREAVSTVALVECFLGKVPILGVCLGHQILGEVLGYKIQKSPEPLHGGTKEILIQDGSGLLAGMKSPSFVAAYHSLTLVPENPCLGSRVTAICPHGEIMAIEYAAPYEWPALGVQFHPESFLSDCMDVMRNNWLESIVKWNSLKSQSNPRVSSPDDIGSSIGYLT
ncbi:MAG: aminodeoxychorismate/anthranilate synthase component II [Oligoflexales bacterium]|nr:aminodeoxychorismate/anthranilate synthase component II [Oligoflexales bacterium]